MGAPSQFAFRDRRDSHEPHGEPRICRTRPMKQLPPREVLLFAAYRPGVAAALHIAACGRTYDQGAQGPPDLG